MASVQSAPLAPQPGGMSLPPGFTPQQAREAFAKYSQMKGSGVPPDNPEMVRLREILAIVQKTAHFQKQLKENQARMQQNQSGAQAQTNGVNGNSVKAPLSTPSTQSINSTSTPVNANSASSTQPSSNAASQPSTSQKQGASASFTPEQLSFLRNQIMAFKLLSKNQPIPPAVQQQLFASQQAKLPPTTADAVATAGQIVEKAAQENLEAAGGAEDSEAGRPRAEYETFTSPYSHLHVTINYADHGLREKRLMIPSIMPSGVDVDRVREERERIVYNRIMARRAELEKLPANLAGWDTKRSDAPDGNDSLKLKALIEYKMLCLLPKQRLLRQQFSKDLILNENLAMTANRSVYRRMKKQSFREARITEKLEKQQRDAREKREQKKHVDYLQSILNHGQEIRNMAVTQKARIQKLGRMMMSHHQHIEKEEQKRVERTAKQRLQALKANDEDAYLKLLDQAKDTRISHLIKQTDGFLEQLAASVKQQQRSAAEIYGDKEYQEDEADDDDDDDDEYDDEDAAERRRKIDYYQVAHRIKEEIHVQPNILVGGTLKEYQVKGLQWMISLYNNNLNGILADEMGLGKTIQTISLITYLVEKKKQNGPFLVIVPLSTLTNWNLEFEKWAPDIRRIVYKGPPLARKQQQTQIRYTPFQVLLTTYEYIIKDRPVLSKIKWVHMIVDEGHRMKNAQSKLSNTLTQYYNTRYRLILTGTPLQNNLPELWALLNFVLPTIFKSVKSFDEWFNTPFANTGGQDKMELTEEEQLLVIRRLHKVLRPFLLRRLKKDVEKDLPEKQETVIKCKFSALQTKLYKQLADHQKLFVNTNGIKKGGVRGLSNMLMQLRKLCNHPYVFGETVIDEINPSDMIGDDIWRTSGKFELLDRILPKFKKSGHRVLMFFQMTAIMDIMEQFLNHRGEKFLRLDGSTKSDDRSDLLKLFNAPDSPYFCFLLSTRAGGLGLNLQTADTVIIFDSDWNPHQDLQAQDRAHRIGQKNEVRILRLISSNSVEEKILERAQFKLNMDGKVIQAGKFDNKSTNEEREAMLRDMIESVENVENLGQEEQDDDDLNLIMARSEDEIELFKQMDEERDRDSEYGPGKRLPRLMAEEELPDIYLQEGGPLVEELDEEVGRGARKRTQVKYDDGLTEEQWLEAVDDSDDSPEAAIERKQARIQKRQSNKDKRQGGEDSPAPSREESEPPLVPKKRGRKPKAEKRKADEVVMERQPPAKRKRGNSGKPMSDALSAEERVVLQGILNNVYEYLMDLEEPIPGEDEARGLIDPFIKVVSKTQYPDYHILIQHPIAMDNIKKKIKKEDYSSLKEFRDDIRLLCNNARMYNEDASQLYLDANTIENACVAKLREETEKHPEFADFDDQNSSAPDGQSTGPVSSVGTPLASGNAFGGGSTGGGGGTKIMLKLNHSAYTNGDNNGRQSDGE